VLSLWYVVDVVTTPISHHLNPLAELVVEIFRLNGALLSQGDRMTQDLGMSSSRWQVLGAVELVGRPLSVSQVARNMGLARQSVQRLVNELNTDGFVALADNPDHRRAKLIVPTAKGRKVYQEIMRRQAQWSKRTLAVAALSERRLGEATSILRRLREALKGGS
jgi:DNA-binding MarR family transcriptional regulator